VRETAVLSNIIMGILLIFCGVNVALAALPGWMAAIGSYLPLTHAIEAALALAAGASWGQVTSLVVDEATIGIVYAAIGLVMLKAFEVESRRNATLDLA
jgi:ABC-2 type transport system permease protein